MNITRYDVPTEWYHITDIFSNTELAIIDKFIPKSSLEIQGKRSHNTDSRTFVTIDSPIQLLSVFDKFNEWQMRKVFSEITGVNCHDGKLRIELVNDSAGAHLEKHVDIKEKLITFQIYINEGDKSWGTTIYKDWETEHATVPFVRNTGWLTHKNVDTIHGIKENNVTGQRHSVLINYIEGDWNDTEQLFTLQ